MLCLRRSMAAGRIPDFTRPRPSRGLDATVGSFSRALATRIQVSAASRVNCCEN